MTTYVMPMCIKCTRFSRDAASPPHCEAFPEGIPEPIWHSEFDHRKRYADETLLYDPIDEDYDPDVSLKP